VGGVIVLVIIIVIVVVVVKKKNGGSYEGSWIGNVSKRLSVRFVFRFRIFVSFCLLLFLAAVRALNQPAPCHCKVSRRAQATTRSPPPLRQQRTILHLLLALAVRLAAR
jgi:hypothetical protein